MSAIGKRKGKSSSFAMESDELSEGIENGNNGSVATLDAPVSRDEHLSEILKAIVAFRDGDFSVRLPLEWSGIDGRIAEAFNQTIIQEDHVSREIARLSIAVGKEGR